MKKEWIAGYTQERVIRLYQRQGGLCGYCGTPKMFLRSEVSKKFYQGNKHLVATFDHVVPDCRGGKVEMSNGVCACSRCNTLKSDLSLDEFFEQYDALFQKLIEKPARVAAKRKEMVRKNGYILAWLADKLGETVEDLFLEHVYTTDEIAKLEKAA